LGGFSLALGQLVGMSSLIYVFYSWDIIEPVTFLVGAFYAMFGAGIFLWMGVDFEWGCVYTYLKNKRLAKLCAESGVDM